MLFAYSPWALGVLLALPAGLPDKGVFSSLDPSVAVQPPVWASPKQLDLAVERKHGVLTLRFDGEPVKAYPIAPSCERDELDCLGLRASDGKELQQILKGRAQVPFVKPDVSDQDGDGIADSVDILLGAKKTVLLRSAYKETAPKLAYPGGDVPTDVGVCTDVIVRALRNAGIDLQKEIFEDAGKAPKAYPGIPKRNTNLDHRRVRNLAVYFKRHWRPIQRRGDLLPGDVVMLDTFPDRPGPDHIGIVSDLRGPSGSPLIINAWTNGYHTDEMDLLSFVPMTIAYRAPASKGMAPRHESRGTSEAGVFDLPASTRQVVLVTAERWGSPDGQLSTWERDKRGAWKRHSAPTRVALGAAGLGWGRGLHPSEAVAWFGGPTKREGDDRSPAGMFRLSSATGYGAAPPAGTKLPYQHADDQLRCVDDPKSADYNQLRRTSPGQPATWESDEAMRRSDDQYRLTVLVDHNRDPVVSQAGSCILLHVWPAPGVPSPGCTTMSLSVMKSLVTWLDPRAQPVLVQLPLTILGKAAGSWNLSGDLR
jgi:uncharacterized protein YijF (DUF1287 family)